MRFSTGIVAGVLVALVGTTPVAAQTASRIGPSTTAIIGAVRGTNSAYDYKNGQYLVVSAYGGLNGVFVTADGVVGAPFVMPTGDFAHFPGVAYSPDLFGGVGGFLVTWHQSFGQGALVHARFVTATGVLGPEIVAPGCAICAVSSGGSWWEAAADVAYSTVSKEFLVVWQGAGITGQRIDLNGQLLGGNFQITPAGAYGRDPAVVYNPTTNQFMVSFGSEDAASPFAGFQRVAAGSGALVGPEGIVGRARGVYITEVAYNSTTNQYLVSWYQGGTYGVLVDANGVPLTSVTLLSVAVTAYDALGIDYNPSSGTFLMVSHTQSPEDGAVEISAGLVPDIPIIATAAGGSGNFYPKVSSRAGAAQWLLTTATGFGLTTVQRLGSTATGGGVGGPPPPPPPPNPVAAATAAKADFSSDGKADIVWQRDDGYISAWAMNGTTAISTPFIVPVRVDPAWRVSATGDFNGDGKADLVWQHTDGWLAVWYMNGATAVASGGLSPAQVDPNWKIVGAGDFNGDGATDLVWQHTNGFLVVWYMNGATALAAQALNPGQVDVNWKPVGAGDFNGDGKPDLVWQHTNGSLCVWYMNGPNMVGTVYMNPANSGDQNWRVRGIIDLNGDGHTDLIWQHMAGGWPAVWFMNGVTSVNAVMLNPSTISPGWKIMGPR
jgi:hypothetical protein